MITFKPFKTFESKVYEGVKFTLRIFTEAMRNGINLSQAEAMADLRRCQTLVTSVDTQNATADQLSELFIASDRITGIRMNSIDPAYFRSCFKSIEGFSIEGVDRPLTADDIIDHAPIELYNEIMREIRKETGLDAGEAQNFESPSTSTAAAEGQTNDTTAASASETVST